MPKMIYGDRHLIADNFPHFFYVLFQKIETLFCNMNSRKRMCGIHNVIAFLLRYHILRHRAALYMQNVRCVMYHIIHKAKRRTQCPRLINQKPDAKIHLEHCEAHFHSFLKGKSHRMTAPVPAICICITVDTYSVSVSAAQQLINRDSIRLAREIPQSNLNTAYAASLSRRSAELFDFIEKTIHFAWILSQNSTLEHQRVCFARSVPYFSIACKALICIQLHECASLWCTVNICETHVCNFQR